MKSLKLLIFVAIALQQVYQVYSFYTFFQSYSASVQLEVSQQAPVGATTQQFHQNFNNNHLGGHEAFRVKSKNMFGPNVNALYNGWNVAIHNAKVQSILQAPFHHHIKKAFYDDCGKFVRHCEWVQIKNKTVMPKNRNLAGAQQQNLQDNVQTNSKPEMEYSCFTVHHICVGNTESCVRNSSCDVAIKIIEMTLETNDNVKASAVTEVSSLNNCHLEGQSVIDDSKTPHMFFGIGYATYDAEGKTLECLAPKASDFKLVFLWKNSTVMESDKENARCKPKAASHQIVNYEKEIMNTVRTWPSTCTSTEKKEESFNLKNFLSRHVLTSKYSSFFSPPYSFAATASIYFAFPEIIFLSLFFI